MQGELGISQLIKGLGAGFSGDGYGWGTGLK
jgi:hypothetical protein